MKNYVSTLLITLSTLAIATLFIETKADLTIATYNVTHGKKNDWPKRKDGVCNVIKQLNADIYGFQEVIKENDQLNVIKQALPDYAFVGQPRSAGITGLSLWYRFVMKFATDEHCPIFYHQNKLSLIGGGTFGINGDGWRSALLPRICTWARFKEIATDQEFYVYNTHLDHKDQNRRIIQINLITHDIAQRCGTTPVILMGDFNNTIKGNLEETLSNDDFTHARMVTEKQDGPLTTHLKAGKPFEIDHILIKPKNAFTIKLYKVFDTMSDTTSDHDPVEMIFSLK